MWNLPIKTDWMAVQMKHEQTRRYAQEIFEVVANHPYDKALEIGCAWGVSTLSILLAQPKGHLTSVDPNTHTKAPAEVMENNLPLRWKFVEARSENFWKTNREKFDLVYIDGSHLYKNVHIDLTEGWEALNPGGLLMIDDFTHKKNREYDPTSSEVMYGVSLACWQLVQDKQIKDIRTKPHHILYMRKP